MGLLDVLNGMQNGPRGAATPHSGSSSGGMSPLMMAMLGLLAYKAVKSMTHQTGASPAPAPSPGMNPGASGGGPAGGFGGGLGGGLGGMLGGLGGLLGGQGANAGAGGLGGLLGGLLGGGAAGSVLSGGLGDLLKQFQQSGLEDAANSWVGDGPNHSISPTDLAKALGGDQIKTLMEQSGLSQNELLSGLAQHLPDVINALTPNGRLPTEHELSHIV